MTIRNRSTARRWAAGASGALLITVAVVIPRPETSAHAKPPPAVTLPLPPQVSSWGAPRFVPGTSDGIVLDFTGQDGTSQLGYVRADGSRFQCLTCTTTGTMDVGRPVPFGDGRRVLAQSPPTSHTGPLSYVVVECRQSVAKCEGPTVLPLDGLSAGDSVQDRIPLVSPDGSTLVWTRQRADGSLLLAGRLQRLADRYRVSEVRVLNAPPDRNTTDLAGLARANAWYEAKSFSPDGQQITFGATLGGSLNLDSYLMDLRTGATRRLTDHPDWDEGLEISPDGRWFAQATSRGRQVTAALGNLPRPPVLDLAAVHVLSYFLPRGGGATPPYRRGAQRRAYVFGIAGESPRDHGTPTYTAEDDGWYVSDWPDWSADGSRLVWAQWRPGEPDVRQIRVVPVPLPAHRPQRVAATPVPTWAPEVSSVPVVSLRLHRVFSGPQGGTAHIDVDGTAQSATLTARYTDYRDGCTVLNGHQTVVRAGQRTTLREELTLTGCHTGDSRIDVSVVGPDGSGTATSTYDGRRETTLFTPAPR